jgi:DNA-binding winged helix-turn-helix (wHTH) protein
MADASQSRTVRFGLFEVDLRAGELRKNGIKIKLQEQPFRVLVTLLQHPGDVFTREELHSELWPTDTFVDFEHGLNAAVKRLRDALDDSAENPRFIETLPRRGYRFIAAAVPDVIQPEKSLSPLRRWREKQRAKHIWLSLGLLALLCGVGIFPFSWRLARKPADVRLPSIEVVPLVALHGMQRLLAFSPDGNQVAFMEIEGGKGAGIYTTLIGGEKSLRLTDNPGDSYPTWSPDSRQIAFLRTFEKENGILELGIYVVPALGGTEHRLYMGPHSYSGGLDWSPDGSALVFPESIILIEKIDPCRSEYPFEPVVASGLIQMSQELSSSTLHPARQPQSCLCKRQSTGMGVWHCPPTAARFSTASMST